jgi:hypothetical protein
MMKKNQLLAFVAAALLTASGASAQWTVTGTVVHPTVLNNNVSVGTTVNGANFYVEKANAVTLGIKSQTAGATMFMDKGAVAANAAFAYKTAGVTTWNSGMLGSNNFSIRNVGLNSFPIIVNVGNDNVGLCSTGGNVGVGTAAPAVKLDVLGSARVTGNLNVTNNSSFGASMNVSGDITSTGLVSANTLNVSGQVNIGTSFLLDNGAIGLSVHGDLFPDNPFSHGLGTSTNRWTTFFG